MAIVRFVRCTSSGKVACRHRWLPSAGSTQRSQRARQSIPTKIATDLAASTELSCLQTFSADRLSAPCERPGQLPAAAARLPESAVPRSFKERLDRGRGIFTNRTIRSENRLPANSRSFILAGRARHSISELRISGSRKSVKQLGELRAVKICEKCGIFHLSERFEAKRSNCSDYDCKPFRRPRPAGKKKSTARASSMNRHATTRLVSLRSAGSAGFSLDSGTFEPASLPEALAARWRRYHAANFAEPLA